MRWWSIIERIGGNDSVTIANSTSGKGKFMAYIVTCIKRESTCEIQLGYDIAAGLSHQSEEEEQDH